MRCRYEDLRREFGSVFLHERFEETNVSRIERFNDLEAPLLRRPFQREEDRRLDDFAEIKYLGVESKEERVYVIKDTDKS
jgi:hypothetical protein